MQRRRRSRQSGQAVVEFGIIAILFTLLMFAIVDFGLLLNTWLSVSAGTRQLARNASTLTSYDALIAEAGGLSMPAVSPTPDYPTPCCTASSALEVQVEYYPCDAALCAPFALSQIDAAHGGSCTAGPCYPQAGDSVRVTLIAHAAQVITPLVRPFFGCTDGTQGHCYVPLQTTTTMRVEGID